MPAVERTNSIRKISILAAHLIYDGSCVRMLCLVRRKLKMDKWECNVCGYVYDPALGDPKHNIPPQTPFEELPDSWKCPQCGASKDQFTKRPSK